MHSILDKNACCYDIAIIVECNGDVTFGYRLICCTILLHHFSVLQREKGKPTPEGVGEKSGGNGAASTTIEATIGGVFPVSIDVVAGVAFFTPINRFFSFIEFLLNAVVYFIAQRTG
ncbi:hypothetical protein PEC301889_09050 [Pectobacterium carotovorum subsp. carotovorum]|nr:hypothetical protein PEC301889_09050 [Pectobacterium carotovorum subsp. carotovorum]